MQGRYKTVVFLTAMAVFCILSGLSAKADALGQNVSFNVNSNYDAQKRALISATLRYVGQRAYFYVDDSYWNTKLSVAQRELALDQIESLAKEFDSVIYPTETATWGSEPNPGIDNDLKITILLEDLIEGSGGYFETVNGFSRESAPISNQREMLIIGAASLGSGFEKVFLAHEFQHLISFQQKELTHHVSEEVWLNELRSEYSPTLAGYTIPYEGSSLQRRVNAFLKNPSDSLTEWPNETLDYAGVALFGDYLVGRYGRGILSETLKMPLAGFISLDRFWSDKKIPEKFSQVFADWMAANYINDPADTRLSYVNSDLRSLHVTSGQRSYISSNSQTNASYSIKSWQPVWHEFLFNQPLADTDAVKISFNGETGQKFSLAMAVFYDDGSYKVRTDQTIDGTFSIYVINPEGSIGASSRKVNKIMLAMTHVSGQPLPTGTYVAYPLNSQVSVIGVKDAYLEASNLSIHSVLESGAVADGTLIKRNNNEPEMYVIEGKYKRYLRPEIIALYGHLNPANVVPLASMVFDSYTTANYVRVEGEKRVWVIWPDGTRHWLNISGEQFTASGRDWNAIFTINDAELAAYRTGIDIAR